MVRNLKLSLVLILFVSSFEVSSQTISAGYSHCLAIDKDANVVCWGEGDFGQVNPPTGLKAVAVGAGRHHSLALTDDGSVIAWGSNERGQCDVPLGLKAIAISAGEYHNLALTKDGAIVAWGESRGEALYIANDRTYSPAAQEYVFNAISAGATHSLGIRRNGILVAEGAYKGRYNGQTYPREQVGPLEKISAGGGHSVAITERGDVVAWGLLFSSDKSAVHVPTGLKAVEVSTKSNHNLALQADGSVVAWGMNESGQCDVPSDLRAIEISAGENFSLALTNQGKVVAWGKEDYGVCTVPRNLIVGRSSDGARLETAPLPLHELFSDIDGDGALDRISLQCEKDGNGNLTANMGDGTVWTAQLHVGLDDAGEGCLNRQDDSPYPVFAFNLHPPYSRLSVSKGRILIHRIGEGLGNGCDDWALLDRQTTPCNSQEQIEIELGKRGFVMSAIRRYARCDVEMGYQEILDCHNYKTGLYSKTTHEELFAAGPSTHYQYIDVYPIKSGPAKLELGFDILNQKEADATRTDISENFIELIVTDDFEYELGLEYLSGQLADVRDPNWSKGLASRQNRADRILNVLYQDLLRIAETASMAKDDKDLVPYIREAQRAWITLRDFDAKISSNACSVESQSSFAYEESLLNSTLVRIEQLVEFGREMVYGYSR